MLMSSKANALRCMIACRSNRLAIVVIARSAATDVPLPVPRFNGRSPWWVVDRGRCPVHRAKQGDSQS